MTSNTLDALQKNHHGDGTKKDDAQSVHSESQTLNIEDIEPMKRHLDTKCVLFCYITCIQMVIILY